MAENPRQPSPAQMDPALLPDDDTWTWTCKVCHLVTQGGRVGFERHWGTVHPDRELLL